MQFQNLLLKLTLAVVLLPLSAPALLMRENGPEPVIVEIKESLRLSDELDNRLNQLASLRSQKRLNVVKWWAGPKLLVMLAFPSSFTQEQALEAIASLKESPAVEKVVALSAHNLEFKSGDFAREFGANDAIPDVARRGFDRDRPGRRPYRAPDQLALLDQPHVPDRLIVRWKDEYVWRAERTGFDRQMAAFNRTARCRVISENRRSLTEFVQLLESEDVSLLADKLKKYMDSGLVEYAQPDYLYSPVRVPNDPAYSNAPGTQWNLRKINAEKAWDMTVGNPSVIVAIGDTGLNLNHPDFKTNLWNGQHWDFYYERPDVSDTNGHGSNVAGIIGAQGDNAFVSGSNGGYMTGVAWDVSMMILKVFNDNSQPSATTSTIAKAIDYARVRGVTAMNLSLSARRVGTNCIWDDQPGRPPLYCEPPSEDPEFTSALRRARGSNMVIVSAAGNNGSVQGATWEGKTLADNDDPYNMIIPANIPTDNNITVLATTPTDTKASYSSYGRQRVDLGAPGGAGGSLNTQNVIGLRQTYNANSFDWATNYTFFAGTSMAAPHVTGALALIKSRFPWERYAGIRDRVLMGTDRTGNLACRTGGRLNLHKALQPRSMIRNLSTRARVENGERVLIGGFTIGGSGSGSLRVAIRGIGPALDPYFSAPTLNNPKITVYNSGGNPIWVNDNWQNDSAHPGMRQELINSGIQPSNAYEAAVIGWLPPGSFTAVVESADGQHGIGMFEIYELQDNANEQTRILNMSTRCLVGTGQEEAVAGTMIGNFNPTNLPKPDRRFLIFGKGPSLPVPGALQDPQIQVLTTGELNDNFDGVDQWLAEEIGEAGLAPTNGRESALWPTFQAPASLTVALRGTGGATGIGLIEFYEY